MPDGSIIWFGKVDGIPCRVVIDEDSHIYPWVECLDGQGGWAVVSNPASQLAVLREAICHWAKVGRFEPQS